MSHEAKAEEAITHLTNLLGITLVGPLRQEYATYLVDLMAGQAPVLSEALRATIPEAPKPKAKAKHKKAKAPVEAVPTEAEIEAYAQHLNDTDRSF